MIQIHAIDERSCLVVICDICGERIIDAAKAVIVFGNFMPNGSRSDFLAVHKRNIDGKLCHKKADDLLVSQGKHPGWAEMKLAPSTARRL